MAPPVQSETGSPCLVPDAIRDAKPLISLEEMRLCAVSIRRRYALLHSPASTLCRTGAPVMVGVGWKLQEVKSLVTR